MADAGIVRNRAKVLATIANARATLALRDDPEGDLGDFVWSFRPADTPRPSTYADVPTTSPESLALSKGLKRKGFVFVGADHDVRADGGGRHRRHPPARLAPARQQRRLAPD